MPAEVKKDLAEYERWRPFLHDIGTFEVKHGARVSVTNLYSDEVGNPNLPKKLQVGQETSGARPVGRSGNRPNRFLEPWSLPS